MATTKNKKAKSTKVDAIVHGPDPDNDVFCICGGLTVWFDDGDRLGDFGEGCEISGEVFPYLTADDLDDEDDNEG